MILFNINIYPKKEETVEININTNNNTYTTLTLYSYDDDNNNIGIFQVWSVRIPLDHKAVSPVRLKRNRPKEWLL